MKNLDGDIERKINQIVFKAVYGQEATTVQSLILKKPKFNRSSAKKWASNHGFKHSKVDETKTSFRFRQFPPNNCKPSSFRTKSLTTGVSAVICKKK